jgi:hypothetical protein
MPVNYMWVGKARAPEGVRIDQIVHKDCRFDTIPIPFEDLGMKKLGSSELPCVGHSGEYFDLTRALKEIERYS